MCPWWWSIRPIANSCGRPSSTCAHSSPGPQHTVTVIIPEFVVEHWWDNVLHNQNALRLKAALLGVPWVVVISIPFHIGAPDAEEILPT